MKTKKYFKNKYPLGFTLVEMAIVIVIIGLIAGMILPAIIKSIKREQTSNARQQVKIARDEVIGYAMTHKRLPTIEEFKTEIAHNIEPFGSGNKYLFYRPANTLTANDICNQGNTTLGVNIDGNNYNNIAFVVISRGENLNLQIANNTDSISLYKPGEIIDSYPNDIDRTEEYDDIAEYVTLNYLKNKIGCGNSAKSTDLPGNPSKAWTFNDPNNPEGTFHGDAKIINIDGEMVLSLDGNGDYLDVTQEAQKAGIDYNAPAAVCMWFKSRRNAKNSAGMLFTMTDNGATPSRAKQFYINAGSTTYSFNDDQIGIVRWNVPPSTDKLYRDQANLWTSEDGWHVLCVSCNGTIDGTSAYFDGLPITINNHFSKQDSGLFGDDINVQVVTFGARVTQQGADAEFSGYVDDYAIYDRNTEWGQHFDICKAREFFNNRANVGREAIAYYPFNENANDQSGEDQLGQNHDGLLHNNPYPAKNRFGCENKAFKFNKNKQQWIQIDNVAQALANKNTLTISAWIWLDSNTNSNKMLSIVAFNKQDKSPRLIFSILGSSDSAVNRLGVKYTTASGFGLNIVSSKSLNDSSWHHVAFTLDNNKCVLYLDGKKDTEINKGWSEQINQDDLASIAQAYNSSQQDFFFNGKIDDIAIFDKVLNLTEIKNIYYGRRIDINYAPQTIATLMPPWDNSPN
ncbi:LamG-like jellyroll fold domain-containing protein [Desulfonauticus submarinus]